MSERAERHLSVWNDYSSISRLTRLYNWSMLPIATEEDLMATRMITTPVEAPASVVRGIERVLGLQHLERKAAFVARAFNAVAQLATEIDERTLNDVAGARSDYEVLM